MKQTRRKLLKWSAMIGAGTALAACAQPAPTAAPQPTKAATQPTAAPQPTKAATQPPTATAQPTAAAKKKVNLVAWFADRRTINVMTEEVMKAEFQKANSHIEVEIVFVPEPQIPAKMATAFAGNQAPNITALDETQLSGFLKQGFIKPIPEGIINVAQEMGKRVADTYRVAPGPAYHALPNGNMPCVLFYNNELLQKKGLKPEQIPTKWDEFIAWAKELTVWKGDEISQWGFTFVGAPWIWDSVAYQKGSWMFKDSKKCMLDDPANADAWRFVLDLLDKHKLDFRTAPLTPQDRVGQGLAYTCLQFGFGYGFFKTTYPNTSIGTLPLPTFAGKPPFGRSTDDLGFCVTVQSKDADIVAATWTLYRYLVGPDYQRRYAVLRGVQPSLLKVSSEEMYTEKNPEWRGIALATKAGNFKSDGIWPAEATGLIHQDLWERIVNKNEAPTTVLKDHTAKVDQILVGMDNVLLTGRDGWKAEWERG